jgi:GNAT superfamily N-acetyltransferase
MLLAVNPFDHWPMFLDGLRGLLASSDGKVHGAQMPLRQAEAAYRAGLAQGRFQMGLFFDDGGELLGFNILSKADGWLEGGLLYIRPERRGKGLGRATNAPVLELARAKGLRGLRFLSTRDLWTGFDRVPHLIQADGTPVYAFSKEVVPCPG